MDLEQIEKLFEAHLAAKNSDTPEIIVREDSTHFTVTLADMYEFVDIQFEDLLWLSEQFKTKNINIGDRNSLGGCETCDYGSRYELTIYIGKDGLNS